MKKAKRIISILMMLALVMSVFTVIPATSASALSYPILIADSYTIKGTAGDKIQIKYTIYHEYKNEKVLCKIYDSNDNLVATAESSFYATTYTTNGTFNWQTKDDYVGEYKAVLTTQFYTYFEWHEAPTPDTVYINLKSGQKQPSYNNNSSKIKVPKFSVTSGKKQFKVKYTKVSGAKGFQVRYKSKGNWIVKKIKTTKSVTKTIKGLKKGVYQVQVRAFSNGKYSKWSSTKKVKVK